MFVRWPWLSTQRVAGLVAGGAIAAAAIAALHLRNERQFLGEVAQALPMSASLSAQALGDWVNVRSTHARLLATAVSNSPVALTDSARLQPLVQAMIADGGFANGRLISPDTSADQSRVHITPRAGPVTIAQFRAPVTRGNTTVGAVLLDVAITEAAFPHFNAAAPDDKTQRTALLLSPSAALAPTVLRGPRSVALQLMVVSNAGGATETLASESVPRDLQALLDRGTFTRSVYATTTSLHTPQRGIGPGLSGAQVVYATTPVPGTPWVLLREREVAELLALVRPALFVSDAVFALLSLLVMGVVLLWWRTRYQHREAETERLRATFVAGVSHELRTPLTQVRMYAEMLRLGLLSEPHERARALGVIEKETERLSILIDRTMAFVRTGQPADPLPNDTIQLAEGVRRALDALGAVAAERHVQWNVQVDDTLTVRCPRDDLQQVLLNLLDNAMKYGPAHQTITIHAERLRTWGTTGSATDPANGFDIVQLLVHDEGPGIDPAEQQSIWQPFRRGHVASVGQAAGNGIGLAVVRELVERAKGRVYVQAPAASARGTATGATATTGATFVVELPAAE